MKKINNIDDICDLDNFNIDLLKEGIRLAELRMQDENNRRDRVEKRGYLLLSFMILLISYGCRIIYELPTDTICKKYYVPYSIFAITIVFFYIFWLLHKLLKPTNYAALGRKPDDLFHSAIIASDRDSLIFGQLLTANLLDYKKAISGNFEANNDKIALFNKALLWSLISLTPILLYTLYLVTSCLF